MISDGQKRKINIPVRTVVRIELKDANGSQWATADVTERSEHGIGLSLRKPMQPGSAITVRGKLGSNMSEVQRQAKVISCLEQSDGTFQAGLEFLDLNEAGHDQPCPNNPTGETYSRDASQPVPAAQLELDCYEVMQLSPNADSETVERVYRILAQRYHPDNVETGNAEIFIQLTEAYRILGNPEARAGYDAGYRRTKTLQWKIFDQAEAATGREGEKRKREGILELLYAQHLHDPEEAGISIHSLEQFLGCPREHLKVALWYLREKGFIQRTDNGRYSITLAGFEEAEQSCSPQRTPALQLLPPKTQL